MVRINKMIPLKALVTFDDIDMDEKPMLKDKSLESSWKLILQQAVQKVAL